MSDIIGNYIINLSKIISNTPVIILYKLAWKTFDVHDHAASPVISLLDSTERKQNYFD